MIVDQSYSAEIARAVKRSQQHRNVVVYASSKGHEYSWADHFTNVWARANHTGKCSKEVFREAKRKMRYSTPEMHSGEDTAKVTIFGAPCDVRPPFTRKELKMNYLGCQNLPTALWVMKFLNLSQEGQTSAVGRSKEQVGSVTSQPKR
ncbi:hypothetical protein NP493_285g03037 [Ridgeia piscesae]|uniref:Uncharacterized protein n=1 Tax=Ridgeia piscesae TaxID=27915 RepID=A0AAD9NX40_RIDPI|nr:hypothetical protein NP493_285g03037 [Ridgeia piscesae]